MQDDVTAPAAFDVIEPFAAQGVAQVLAAHQAHEADAGQHAEGQR